jgi:hypothetical protein
MGAEEAVMKAKMQCYVDWTAYRQRHLRPMLRSPVNPPIGTGMVRAQMAAPRRSLVALWRRSPLTGRLEMRWQVASAAPVDRSDDHPAAA